MKVALALCVLAYAPPALATADPDSTSYTVEGFTANGRYAVFRKEWEGGAQDCKETWLAVYDARTGRRVRSVPVYRSGEDCTSRRISKKVGAKVRKRFLASYGEPTAGIQLQRARKNLFVAKKLKLSLRLRVKGRLPSLNCDLEQDGKKLARVRLRLELKIGAKRVLLINKRIKLAPGPDPGGASCYAWSRPELTAAVIKDGRASVLALVIYSTPRIIRRP